MPIARSIWLGLVVALAGCAASGGAGVGPGAAPAGKADGDGPNQVCTGEPDPNMTGDRMERFGRCEEPEPAPEPLLTDEEIAQVRRYIDNLCGDTWCEGDFDWWTTDMRCDWTGGCVISFRTRHFTTGSGFAVDALDGIASEDLVDDQPEEQLTATITGSDMDEDGVWLFATCDLEGRYHAREDILLEGGYELRASDTLYEHLSECVFAIEDMMYDLPVATYPEICSADLSDDLYLCVWNLRQHVSDAEAVAGCTSEESLRDRYVEECTASSHGADYCEYDVDDILDRMWESCLRMVSERYPD